MLGSERILELEQKVLSALIKEPDLLEDARITTDNFLYPKHKTIFTNMKKVLEKDLMLDMQSLIEINVDDLAKMGGCSYINELYDVSPSTQNYEYFESKLLETYVIIKTAEEARKFIKKIQEEEDVTLIDDVLSTLQTIKDNSFATKTEETTQDLLLQVYEKHQNSLANGLSGTDTGFRTLNDATDGYQQGDLIIVGARPSLGKTALTVASMLNGVKGADNTYGTFVSAEMPKHQIIERMIANVSNINLMKMKNPNKYFRGDDWDRYSKAVGVLNQLKDKFQVVEHTHIRDIVGCIRNKVKQYPNMKHVFFIDHLDHLRIDGKFQSRHHQISEIVHTLKQAARKNKVAIVLLCQLNRSVEARQEKRPNMSDLRESGSIEQIADVIILLYRDDYYDREASNNVMELIISKNRNGSTGVIELGFIKEHNKFFDLAR